MATIIKDLSRKEYKLKVSVWGLMNTLDRHLASRPTAKGHIHRVGKSAKPSKGISSMAGLRKAKKQIEAQRLHVHMDVKAVDIGVVEVPA